MIGIVTSSSLLAYLQAAPAIQPMVDVTIFGQIERLGLIGILILEVVVLAREIKGMITDQRKNQIMMTEAFVSNTDMVRSMKDSVDSLKDSVDRLSTVRETLDDTHRHRM